MQVTTEGDLSGAINLQLFPASGDYDQVRHRFEFKGKGEYLASPLSNSPFKEVWDCADSAVLAEGTQHSEHIGHGDGPVAIQVGGGIAV